MEKPVRAQIGDQIAGGGADGGILHGVRRADSGEKLHGRLLSDNKAGVIGKTFRLVA